MYLNYLPNIKWGGTEIFIPKTLQVNPNWNIEQMQDICREILKSIIKLGDLCLEYKLVGRDIQIETLI